jgi:hypothetical protein
VDNDRATLAFLNVLMLTFVGVGASFWTLYYTDYLPAVASLLGLGGLFAWVAFLLNVLPAERKKALQKVFDEHCLQSPYFFLLLFVPLLAALVLAPRRGTLVIDNLETSESRVVKVLALDDDRKPRGLVWRGSVAGGGRVKFLVNTGWFGSKDYYVKPTGLPAARVTAASLRREVVVIPHRFTEQPVILVRPRASLIPLLRDGFVIEVREELEGRGNPAALIASEPYGGGTLWIGAEQDVTIPQATADLWRLEMIFANMNELELVRWLKPAALAPTAELRGGSTVIIRLLRPDANAAYTVRVAIPKNRRFTQFPQEVVFE